MRQGMARDFSWERSVATYLDVYRRALALARTAGERPAMDFVFTLHSHLPYVLNHGRWPHGSDWLCEAALDTYLPLLEVAAAARAPRRCPRPVTIGITPVLANQLASPDLRRPRWRRSSSSGLTACDEAPASLRRDRRRRTCCRWWSSGGSGSSGSGAVPRRSAGPDRRLPRARGRGTPRDHRLGRDPRLPPAAGARREHPAAAGRRRRASTAASSARAGRLLAARVRLPAARSLGAVADRAAHRRAPRHRGAPGRRRLPLLLRRRAPRRGRATARPLGRSQRRPALVHAVASQEARPSRCARPTGPTGCAYRGAGGIAAFVRDPRASMQVWSRFEGYPGDECVSRVPQDALARRAQALAGDRRRRGSGRQAALRPRRRRCDRARGPRRAFRHLSPASPPDQAHTREGGSSRHSTPSSSGIGGSRAPTSSTTRYRALARESGRAPGHRLAPPRGASSRGGDPAPCGLVGSQRRLQHVAQRAHRVDLGAPLAAGGSRSGTSRPRRSPPPPRDRCWPRRHASCCSRSRPTGSSSSPPAPRPTTRERRFRSTAPTPSAHRGAPRRAVRTRWSRPSAGPKCWPARSTLPRRHARGGRRARRLPLPRRRLTMTPIRFAFGLHLHQPVGNFDHVFEQHVDDVYRPLLNALADREFLPVVLHLSGPLLEWLEAHESALSGPARTAGRDGKVELLLAGFYEPVLASLPARGPGRADPVDAGCHPRALRRRGRGALAHRTSMGARARGRSGRRGRPLRPGGRPPLPGLPVSRRAAPRAVLDRERWKTRRRSFPSTSGCAT